MIQKQAKETRQGQSTSWLYGLLIIALSFSLSACGEDSKPQAQKEKSSATSETASATATDTNADADTTADMDADGDTERELPPIPEEYLAVLSSEETKTALGNALPGHIWLAIEGQFINSLGPDAYEADIRLPGGIKTDEGQITFAPAYEHGRLAEYRGLNERGPYALTIETEAIDVDNTATGSQRHGLVIILPPDAQAGQSYEFGTPADAGSEQALAYVGLHKQPRPYDAKGVIDVLELGDLLTVSWDVQMTGREATDGQQIRYQGAVQGIAFTPQMEFDLEYQLAATPHTAGSRANYKNESGFRYHEFMAGDRSMGLRLPYSFELTPGTHELGDFNAEQPEFFVMNIDSDLSGRLEVVDVGDYYEMRYEFEAVDEDAKGSGVISHIPKDLFQWEYY